LKENLTDLNLIISISVSSVSSIVSGSGVIAAFKSFLSSSTSNPDPELEKGSDLKIFEEPAALIVDDKKLVKEVFKNIRKLRKNNNETAKMEAAQSLYTFFGCIALFGIVGYDFFNFVTEQSNGTYVDFALLFLVSLVFITVYVRKVRSKEDSLTRIDEEKILYHLNGLKYDERVKKEEEMGKTDNKENSKNDNKENSKKDNKENSKKNKKENNKEDNITVS
ncbi:3746_t:CDS:2, partial [Dentiscutata erythropus]